MATFNNNTVSSSSRNEDRVQVSRQVDAPILRQNLQFSEEILKRLQSVFRGILNNSSKLERSLFSPTMRDLPSEFSRISTVALPPPPKLFKLPDIELREFNEGWGGPFIMYFDVIPEDSIYRKLLACIPGIGIIPTVMNERSLREKINRSTDPTRLVKLISVKNDYKICSIIRGMLTIALAVAGVALGVISVGVGVGIGIVATPLVAYYAYAKHKNKQLITQLQTSGYPQAGIYVR